MLGFGCPTFMPVQLRAIRATTHAAMWRVGVDCGLSSLVAFLASVACYVSVCRFDDTYFDLIGWAGYVVRIILLSFDRHTSLCQTKVFNRVKR